MTAKTVVFKVTSSRLKYIVYGDISPGMGTMSPLNKGEGHRPGEASQAIPDRFLVLLH